ncbi:MAG: hypothetical protein KGN99_11920 [Pseudomonadota bacterium]|nr:hypothetical protein [Pseudomonadota bacterium]
MLRLTGLLLMLTLQACSGMYRSSEVLQGEFSPLTPAGTNKEAFQEDRSSCLKQVEKEVGKLINENFAIIKFRNCLIQKGYVLLS